MKIKHLLFTLSILVAAATAYCQPSKFKITYSHNSNAEWAGSSLCLPGDQYLFNSYYGWQDGQGLLMLLLDSQGTVIDVKSYQSQGKYYQGLYAGSLVEVDGFYYVGGAVQYANMVNPNDGYGFPFIAKYDLNRDTVWVKQITPDSSFHLIYGFRKSLDNNFFIVGAKSTNIPGLFDFFLYKVDTSGNLIWHKTYGLANRDEICISVDELADSSIVISGMQHYSGSVPNLNYKPWILKTDKKGNILKSKQYTMPSMQYGGVVIKAAKTGGYWISGLADSVISGSDALPTYHLTRLDDNFNIVRRTFFNSKWLTTIWDFHELNNGKVVFCGNQKDSASNRLHGYIAQVDSNGALQWWRSYHEYPNNNNYLSCIRPAPDGGFVACGSAFGLPNGTSQDAWIIKTDSMGCVVANCQLGIDDIITTSTGVSIYPNPARSRLNVTIPAHELKGFPVLSAYDITGRQMIKLQGTSLRQKTRINTETWPSGLYLISVQQPNGESSNAKVMIEQ